MGGGQGVMTPPQLLTLPQLLTPSQITRLTKNIGVGRCDGVLRIYLWSNLRHLNLEPGPHSESVSSLLNTFGEFLRISDQSCRCNAQQSKVLNQTIVSTKPGNKFYSILVIFYQRNNQLRKTESEISNTYRLDCSGKMYQVVLFRI